MNERAATRKKRSNSEHKRQSRRSAAKDRRDKESELLDELKEAMPLVAELVAVNIDRMSLIRLAVTFSRLRACVPKLMENFASASDAANLWSEDLLNNCLDGYIMICGSDGVVLYTTESVFRYLGLTQTDLVGHMLQEFVSKSDYEDLCRAAAGQEATTGCGRPIVMRMKSVVGPRGRKLNLKSPFMKPITFTLRTLNDTDNKRRIHLLLAPTTRTGQGNLHDEVANRHSPTAFVTRHTCDMKFTYVDECVKEYLNFEPKTLMGTSFYDLVHPADLPELIESLKELFKKMNCRTPYFRLICADGAAIWVQTEAGLASFSTHGQRAQYVICSHQFIGRQNYVESETISAVTDSCQIVDSDSLKTNVDDCSLVGQRRESFDDVLQWLTCDLPDSPRNDHDASKDQATTTATRTLLQQQKHHVNKQQYSPITIKSRSPTPYRGNDVIATEFSPLSDSMAVCQLQEYRSINNNINDNNTNDNNSNDILSQQVVTSGDHFANDGDHLNNDVNATHRLSDISIIGSTSCEDAPEMLETLAPFLAQEEMLPLDMQGLIADFNIDDWFPSDLEMQTSSNRSLKTPLAPILLSSPTKNVNTIPITQLQLNGDVKQLQRNLADQYQPSFGALQSFTGTSQIVSVNTNWKRNNCEEQWYI